MATDYSQLREDTISYKRTMSNYKVIGNEPIASNEFDIDNSLSYYQNPLYRDSTFNHNVNFDSPISTSRIYYLTKTFGATDNLHFGSTLS